MPHMRRCISWVWAAVLLLLFAVGCGGNHGSLPNNPTNNWSIGAGGGTFHSESNEVTLVVPAGSVATTTRVTATKLSSAPTPPAGTAYVAGSGWQFTHVNFSTPATLTVKFPAGTPTTGLQLYRRADGATEWTAVATTLDAAGRTASAQVGSFSSYALFYPAGTGWNWTAAGGAFTFETLTVTLPADAVSEAVEVQPRRTPAPFTPPAGWTAVNGATFDLGSSNTSLETSAAFTVAMTYEAAAVPEPVRESVKVFYKENEASEWVGLTSVAEAANLKVSATSSTLGTFAVFYPTPVEANAYWVEQRNNQNSMIYDVYTANFGGNEQLTYSPSQMQGSNQLRVNTFRWADKSFLGLDFSSASETYLMSFNIQTNTPTRLFLIPRQSGSIFSGLEMARTRTTSGTDGYVIQVSERNPTTFEARDRLLRFTNGSSTPTVLMSFDRHDSEPPAIMRPWDIDSSGRVLALLEHGLALFNTAGTNHFVLAGPERGPGEAYFSPDGLRVLFVQFSGEEAGWKVADIATGNITSIPGLQAAQKVRWASNTHVISCVPSGDDRRIDVVDVATGAASRITTAGAHATSFINDVGAR